MLTTTSTKTNFTEKTIKLFNAVLIDDTKKNLPTNINKLVSKTLPYRFILTPEAASVDNVDEVIEICQHYFIDGAKANSSFYKSWNKVVESSREEILVDQVLHYITTYGFKALGIYDKNSVYIPAQELQIPEVTDDFTLNVIHGLTANEIIDKALNLLKTGIALDESTIINIIGLLQDLNFNFKNVDIDSIKNKEAKLRIAHLTGILPSDPTEFVRYLIYRATGSTLLIKDPGTIEAIKKSEVDISHGCTIIGEQKLAEVFYRFKSIFLAFKHTNPNNRYIVNRIRKLAKKYHQPISEDYLNNLTSKNRIDSSKLKNELSKVNNFRKIRLLEAIKDRLYGSDYILYQIRNGKSYLDKLDKISNYNELLKAFNIIASNLKNEVSNNVNGKVIKYPKYIDYAVPSSEKKFVGNFPQGTIIDVSNSEDDKNNIIAGIYWQNDYGANDLDLSAISINGKVGWNASFGSIAGGLVYSGDITDAPDGASEVMYTTNLNQVTLLKNNVYSGNSNCKYKIFFAKGNLTKDVENNNKNLVNPNNIILEADTYMPQRQSIVGILTPNEDNITRFILLNIGGGNISVSNENWQSKELRNYLYEKYKNPITLKSLLKESGAIIIDEDNEDYSNEDINIDLSAQTIEKDTIINLISNI